MKYEYIPHTADAKFIAYGKNVDDVFSNSALAMMNILGKTSSVNSKKNFEIRLKANNYERLLYDFLEELLFLIETENFFLSKIKRLKIDKNFDLFCIVEGDDIANYEVEGHIKAVTYSEMEIRKTNKGYEAVVVVDI